MTPSSIVGMGVAEAGVPFPIDQLNTDPHADPGQYLQNISHDISRLRAEMMRNTQVIADNHAETDSIRIDIANATIDEWRSYAMCRLADIRLHNSKIEQENLSLSKHIQKLFDIWGQMAIGVN